ncbi:MAG TPA: tetratricopeptide repeat protein [Gemmatimonadaceae bacterium]|nr:tetratricopeptide repeat protein [Gemmatimonadaceae bacterium]
MPTPFLSSEEYDERAHELYNEGQYDEALDVLREGLALYPHAVELHIGVGYARLAREEYAWARRSFEEALVLDAEHEDALAGLGETLLKFGQPDDARRLFRRILALGYSDDIDLMLQVGRVLFRHEMMEDARDFFDVAVREAPDFAEAVASLGYVLHRVGDEDGAVARLRRAIRLDPDHAEARIYLANILFDRGEHVDALEELERTSPEDHWDDLGIWRLIELKKAAYRLAEDAPELLPWYERIEELTSEPDDIDAMLAEIEAKVAGEPQQDVHGQLELFGTLLNTLVERDRDGDDAAETLHSIIAADGRQYMGSWEEIVQGMRDAHARALGAAQSLQEYMAHEAHRILSDRGIAIPTHDAESFIRGSARAGLLRIVR